MPISLEEISKYLATDWTPGMPKAIASGLTEILSSVLQMEQVNDTRYWCLNQDLAATDRQWKGTTSWMLGVAFTRFVIEQERYPWWSPVSAFRGVGSSGKTSTGKWMFEFPRTEFRVEKRSSTPYHLRPDYVTCRTRYPGSYDFGFVESKGTGKQLSNLTGLPGEWSKQVNSVDLYYDGSIVPISRRIVAATRIQPAGSKSITRKVLVRAWNHREYVREVDDVMFAHFLAVHYAGVCEKIGLSQFARLMETAGHEIAKMRFAENGNRRIRIAEDIRRLFPLEFELLASVHRERILPNTTQLLDPSTGLIILRSSQRNVRFNVGDRAFSASLTLEAVDLMMALACVDLDRVSAVATELVERISGMVSHYRQNTRPTIAVTLNGIAFYEA